MSTPAVILYVDTSPKVGGGQLSLIALMANLDRARFHPLLATPPGSGVEQLAASLEVETLPLAIASRTARRTGMRSGRFRGWHQEPWRLAHAAADVRRWIERRGVALVHANNTLAGIVAVLGASAPRRPVVFHHRLESSLRGPGRFAVSRARRIVCVSRAVADALVAPPAKVRVIYDGVDPAAFDRAAAEASPHAAGAPRVLVLGRLSPEKGQDLFLRAACGIAAEQPTARLVLAGEAFLPGDVLFERELRALASTRPLQGRVDFLGFHAEVPRLLAGVDLVVVPSRREGLGIAALEAMAAGCAVVATAVGGLRESVVAGETGLLVPPENAAALGRAMATLLGELEMRRAMGAAGRRRVGEHFTQARMARAIEAIYEELLTGPAAERGG